MIGITILLNISKNYTRLSHLNSIVFIVLKTIILRMIDIFRSSRVWKIFLALANGLRNQQQISQRTGIHQPDVSKLIRLLLKEGIVLAECRRMRGKHSYPTYLINYKRFIVLAINLDTPHSPETSNEWATDGLANKFIKEIEPVMNNYFVWFWENYSHAWRFKLEKNGKKQHALTLQEVIHGFLPFYWDKSMHENETVPQELKTLTTLNASKYWIGAKPTSPKVRSIKICKDCYRAGKLNVGPKESYYIEDEGVCDTCGNPY